MTSQSNSNWGVSLRLRRLVSDPSGTPLFLFSLELLITQPEDRTEGLLNLKACYIIAAQDRKVNQLNRVHYPPADIPRSGPTREKVLPPTQSFKMPSTAMQDRAMVPPNRLQVPRCCVMQTWSHWKPLWFVVRP